MILKKWKLRLQLWLFKRRLKKMTGRTPRWVCEQTVALLDPELFRDYNHQVGQGRIIATFYESAYDYGKTIGRINTGLRSESGSVSPEIIQQQTMKHTTVDAFLSVENGAYASPFTMLTNFKVAAMKLCKNTVASDTAEVGRAEYNARLLKKTFQNITAICLALLEVSVK